MEWFLGIALAVSLYFNWDLWHQKGELQEEVGDLKRQIYGD